MVKIKSLFLLEESFIGGHVSSVLLMVKTLVKKSDLFRSLLGRLDVDLASPEDFLIHLGICLDSTAFLGIEDEGVPLGLGSFLKREVNSFNGTKF